MNLAALTCALALGVVYVLGEWLERFGESLGHRRWMSFAAGVSTAYVFVDVMPELGERNEAMVAIAGEHPLFGAQRIYGLALLAFVLLYGLDHLVRVSRRRAGNEASNAFDFAGLLHVAGFAVYSWLVGYLLVERAFA